MDLFPILYLHSVLSLKMAKGRSQIWKMVLATHYMGFNLKSNLRIITKGCAKSVQIWEHLGVVDIKFQKQIIDIENKFSSVQSLSRVQLFVTPWTATRQASLSITNSRSPPKPMFIESVMPSSHLILCRPLLLLPSIFPSIRVFSNESALQIG